MMIPPSTLWVFSHWGEFCTCTNHMLILNDHSALIVFIFYTLLRLFWNYKNSKKREWQRQRFSESHPVRSFFQISETCRVESEHSVSLFFCPASAPAGRWRGAKNKLTHNVLMWGVSSASHETGLCRDLIYGKLISSPGKEKIHSELRFFFSYSCRWVCHRSWSCVAHSHFSFVLSLVSGHTRTAHIGPVNAVDIASCDVMEPQPHR